MSIIDQSNERKNTMRLNIWGNYFGFIVMGMIVVSFGSIMPYIRETFSLSFEQGGLILAFFSGSYLINGMISGIIVDKIGQKPVLVIGNALYTIGLTLIFFASEPWILYLSVIIVGMGWGFCNTSINILVNDTSKGETKAMSLLHMSFGVGAFFVPILFSIFIKLGLEWRQMMLSLAFMSLIALVLSLKMNIRFIKKDSKNNKKGTLTSPKQLLLYMVILFFYVGGESAFSGWMVSFLMTGLNKLESFSQNMLSTLWMTMIIARYIIGVMNHRIDKAKYVVFASATAVIGMGIFIVAKSDLLLFFAIIIIGLSFAGIYPLTMAHANHVIRGSGFATAAVISGGGLGSALVPYVSGRIADHYGTTAIIVIILVSLICMLGFTTLNYRIHRSKLTND